VALLGGVGLAAGEVNCFRGARKQVGEESAAALRPGEVGVVGIAEGVDGGGVHVDGGWGAVGAGGWGVCHRGGKESGEESSEVNAGAHCGG